MTKVPINFRAREIEADELRQRATAKNLSVTDYILSELTLSGAWRANRIRGPVTPSTVAAEASALSLYWNGDPASPDRWSAVDSILADLGPTFANIDFRASAISELGLRRADIPVAAYAMTNAGEDPSALVRSAFIEWFDAEPEAALDAFSVDDTCKLLLAENAGWAAVVATNQNTQQLTSYCYSEAERAGVAGRRAHSRRILAQWRERGIAWPDIEIDRHGCPRLVDGLKIVLTPDAGRRVPTLVSAPRSAPEPEVHSVSPTPRPGQIGGSAEAARTIALSRQTSAKIGDLPK